MKVFYTISLCLFSSFIYAQETIDYVNPFIGTSNYGATNPGAIAPRGMVSVSPFNVADTKDKGWMSNPYVYGYPHISGFSHVNLSGVGCPDLGVILLMPTAGNLKTNYKEYQSSYSNEQASPGYYKTTLDAYDIQVETTATTRTGISKYHFPKGKSNIILNLGLGLTNEQGGMIKFTKNNEIVGFRNVGSFCYYKPEETYPVYFVIKLSHNTKDFGIWKETSAYNGPEAQWMPYNGKKRIYKQYRKEIVGDSIGAYLSYQFKQPTTVEVKVGVSYVSIENARQNLEQETGNKNFSQIYTNTHKQWNKLLSTVKVEGGTHDDKVTFYTALYHTLIHPNILSDYNGDYPQMAKRKTLNSSSNRYTVFSLWDTYRNLHALMSLFYPDQQRDMVQTMIDIYNEGGWLPKWELNATETTTMVGDPAGIVIADTYLKGIQDFDITTAYKAMVKSANERTNNPLRPGINDYLDKGYLTTKTTKSGSVSTTQEYNITDFAIAQLARELGKKEDSKIYNERSISYRNLFDKSHNLLRPKNDDGSWSNPFNPIDGANFAKNLGFIEGNSWQYTFMVSHDIKGLIKLMGGKKAFTSQLQKVFDLNHFDMANEPDIAYPYLFNYIKGEEWRTQETVNKLRTKYFTNAHGGLPGNDDTGTMSAWLIYSMMGIYPVVPAQPMYTLSLPAFDSISIRLNEKYYNGNQLTIEKKGNGSRIKSISLNGKKINSFFISHKALTTAKTLVFETE